MPPPTQVPGHDAQLLSASGDGEARLWDLSTGAAISKLAGHAGDCLCLSVAADPGRAGARTFATGGLDGTVRLWDIGSGQCVRTFVARSEVNAICMFPTGEVRPAAAAAAAAAAASPAAPAPPQD